MEIKIYPKRLTIVSAFLILSLEIFSQAPPVTSIGTASLAAGTYSVPVMVTGFNNVGNISLSLNYNTAELVYTGVSLNSGLLPANAVITPVSDQSGLFRLSYVSGSAYYLSLTRQHPSYPDLYCPDRCSGYTVTSDLEQITGSM